MQLPSNLSERTLFAIWKIMVIKNRQMKKNVSAFLINNHLYILDYAQNKKAFNNCEATYKKELCLLFEKSGNFFHRPNVKTSLNPLPLFIFACFLRIPLPNSTLTVIFELPPIIMGNAYNLEICPFIKFIWEQHHYLVFVVIH